MRPTMWINVLRPRPRPFKFGWVSISLSYAKKFGFLSRLFCPAFSPVTWSYVINIFCMCLCTHGFIMVHRSRAFHSVWSTAHWRQTRWRQVCFPFHMGSCTGRLNLLQIFKEGRTSRDFNENQPKHQNRNFLKTFCNYLWWNLFTTFF